MLAEQFYLPSNGAGRIFCRKWLPEGHPKAVVQIIHGIAEHAGRYDDFANFLTQYGYAVVADDHMGHGSSIEDGTAGYFHGGWLAAVADEKMLRDKTAGEYPGVPYFMLGHSMGSFLLRTYLYTYPDTIEGAIISGTGWEAPLKVKMGLLLCGVEAKRLGETKTSPVITKLMFGAYNKDFQPQRTKDDWICSDESVVDAYQADPLCGFDPTIGLARDLLTGVQMNERPENLAKMDKTLPVLFISGSKDPVGAMSKGVLACIDAFKRNGLRNISIKLYPNDRHEVLNEQNKDEVYQDVLSWLEAH